LHVHCYVTAGSPKTNHPGAMQRLEERCRNRGCFIAQSSTARPPRVRRRSDTIIGRAAQARPSVPQPPPC
jgi:hypothetical protein